MSTYFALVHKDAGSAFGIQFPDLPGCFSAADELNDIFRNAEEALALYLADAATLPRSRPLEDLRKDKSLRQELAAGAFLIAVAANRPEATGAASETDNSVTASALSQKSVRK